MKSFLLFFIIFTQFKAQAESCSSWFSKIKIEKNCILECSSSLTDMGTYMCPMQCEDLCKATVDPIQEENFYGLTADEVSFCGANKIDCLKAYRETWVAEKYCLKIYPQSGMNDESDACRHFVWAVLLEKRIGLRQAEVLLNAHENNPKEPVAQRAMDLANNRLGLIAAKRIKSVEAKDILEEFKSQLKTNSLIIIEPVYKKTGGLP